MIDIELSDYLHQHAFEYRDKGNEVYLKYCPECEDPEDGDFSHLSFRSENGLFRCKKCDYKGNLWKFATDRGHLAAKIRHKVYKRPDENKALTDGMDKFREWYHKKRGISPDVLKEFKVGMLTSGEKKSIVYQFYNEDGHLVNRKYKNCQDKKNIWQEKEAEPIYYGQDKISFDEPILFVTEGEDDCHAMYQLGIRNVVSVPHGAGNYTASMDKINRKMETIVLMFDNDEPGQKGAKTFAEKAGLYKCVNIVLPYKDGRECLQNGITSEDVQKLIGSAKPFNMDDIVKASGLKDFMVKKSGAHSKSKKFNSWFGGIRESEMTIWTGHSGNGKTTSAMNLALWLASEDIPVFYMSFENTLGSMARKLLEITTEQSLFEEDQLTGQIRFTKTDSWVNDNLDEIDSLPMYFLNTYASNGYFDVEKVIQTCENAVKFHNIKLFIIDHLHYFLKFKNPKNQTNEIDEAIRAMSMTARRLRTHIILIAHPYKTENPQTGKLAKLGLYCIKGSSSVVQEAHNMVVIGKKENTLTSNWRLIKSREWRTGEITYGVKENRNTYTETIPDTKKPRPEDESGLHP